MGYWGSSRRSISIGPTAALVTALLLGTLVGSANAVSVAAEPAQPADRVPNEVLVTGTAKQRFPVGSTAFIDVSVATLWREPGIHRQRDRASLGNPVRLGRWNKRLRTADHRRWLTGQVQTQALYGQQVLVRAVKKSWVRVAVLDQPEPQDKAGYPGWLPARQLVPDMDSYRR